MEQLIFDTPLGPVARQLEQITQMRPGAIRGLIVVMVAEDGTYGLAYNSCCLGHARESVDGAFQQVGLVIPNAPCNR